MKKQISFGLMLCMLFVLQFSPAFASTIIVSNTNDSYAGSFRSALEETNLHAGADTIVFRIPQSDLNYDGSSGVWIIRPDSALPAIVDDSTNIDATTQSDFIGSDTNPEGPEIQLDGSNAGENADGLLISSSFNMVKGLVITNFIHNGILIPEPATRCNVVSGNYIGTDATGKIAQGNGFSGVLIYGGSRKNTIGGTTAADRNILSGNGWSGAEIQFSGTDSNVVIGNFIGTDVTGTTAIPNINYGVNVWSGAEYNRIGGSTEGERNLISGNLWSGISISGSKTDYTIILGNYIGTDISGSKGLPNGFFGISVGSSHNIIGDTEPGCGNLVSGNGSAGISIAKGDNNKIAGNIIGTDITGLVALPNFGIGVQLRNGAQNNVIGPANFIRYNMGDGVVVLNDSTIGNTITRNSISGNSGMGINNVEGGNLELNPPEIRHATLSEVRGMAIPYSQVEIFSDSAGQGAIFEGTAFADAAGNFSWSGVLTGPLTTATVTDAAGNTSEFSSSFITRADADDATAIPGKYALYQNYPNPFNPKTTISFALPKASSISIRVFNLKGQLVDVLFSGNKGAGFHKAAWDASHLPSGMYVIEFHAGEFKQIRKCVLVK
ncbi:T9SS type A sorting domain-containing protein [candidate division KSB1 bacterium]|nr:T9SS type A sorting domain-containing protein [candidate division KSB1 bacterium]